MIFIIVGQYRFPVRRCGRQSYSLWIRLGWKLCPRMIREFLRLQDEVTRMPANESGKIPIVIKGQKDLLNTTVNPNDIIRVFTGREDTEMHSILTNFIAKK